MNGLTNISRWDAGSIVKNIVKILFCLENINIISYQLFWSMIQLISRNQRAVSPEAQPRVIQPSDCEI